VENVVCTKVRLLLLGGKGGSFGIVVRSLPGGDIVTAPDWGQFSENYSGVDGSPDGTQFATADGAGSFRLWSASTWTSVELTTASIRGERVAFSPEGVFLAVTGSPGLDDIYRVSTREFVTSLGYSDYMHSVAFSPEGSFVAVGTESRNLGIVRTSDWSDVRRITDAHGPTVNDRR
jgi:WD40 repeat protein